MKNHDSFNFFIDQLEKMYNSEQQIVKSLPKLIKLASSEDLKKALSHHLKETEEQVSRLDEIFDRLECRLNEKTCKSMESLLKEADEAVKERTKSPLLDAIIICCAQKVEHYEIACYGTLQSFAKQLNLENNIRSLLKKTLEEEGSADKALTKIAEGTMFTTGVNQEAFEKAARS